MRNNAVMIPLKITRRLRRLGRQLAAGNTEVIPEIAAELARMDRWDTTYYDYPDRGYDEIPEKQEKPRPVLRKAEGQLDLSLLRGGPVMYGIIYKATGPGGKVYIGQTVKTLKARKSAHAFRAKKGDRRGAFQVAILEHGFDSFAWEQIDTADTAEELDRKEKRRIAHYDSTSPEKGYNSTDGGLHFSPNKEVCRKISEAKKGKPSHNKGKPCSEEQKRKTSKALIGHLVSAETRRRISEAKKGGHSWNKGLTMTKEHRIKLSIAHGGKGEI